VSRVEDLVRKYASYVSLPWDAHLSGGERVWFVVYDKADERRLRARRDEFEVETKRAKHDWVLIDLTNAFAEWMAAHPYRESYFGAPDDLDMELATFKEEVCRRLQAAFAGAADPDNTVFAVLGVAGLFGFARCWEIIESVKTVIRGKLLVFFPGQHESGNYRLLDARDGPSYMAVPITADPGGIAE
jgi:hypothetical protein